MDPEFRPDVIAMIASSTALMLTGIPFDGPVAGLRVTEDGKSFKAFAKREEYDANKLDIVVAGIESGITMVEAGAKEVSEKTIIDAIAWAHEAMQPAIELQKKLVKKVGVKKLDYTLVLPDEEVLEEVKTWTDGKLGKALRAPYPRHNELVEELREEFHKEMEAKLLSSALTRLDELPLRLVEAEKRADFDEAFTKLIHNDVREGIIKEGVRPDGRKLTEIRPLSSEVAFLPRTHGSSLFTRGVTQAMNIVTLAPLSYSQVVDTMELTDYERRYMHHYNAPGYTVGEIKRLGSPGRREIGHGYLAERALTAVLPSVEDFPYTIRSVTEIMSQNGSTSMAATCSSCLALMDAGVPIKRPVSGIAMGLMYQDEKAYVLSDIADAEDFAGDMDFKVTGTTEGITALQMDMKVHGLPVTVLKQALAQAKIGRGEILAHMVSILAGPREHISPLAPRIEKITINPEKIGAVIGKGGETINKIIVDTGAEIDIQDSGLITVAASDTEKINKAIKLIRDLTEEPEVGKVYDGTVVSIKDFGAFVNILPGSDGMLHISQLSDKRVENVSDVLKVGQTVRVKLTSIDDKGRLGLTMKNVK